MSSAHNDDLLLPGCLFSMEMSEFNLKDVFFFPLQTIMPPPLNLISFFTAFSTTLVMLKASSWIMYGKLTSTVSTALLCL